MDRKTFLKTSAAGILLSIPVVSVLSCSGSDDGVGPNPNPDPDPDPSGGNCLNNGTNNTIGANHGHSFSVPKEDVESAVEKTYTLSEASTDQHIHEVTLTAANFNSLKNNNSIVVNSTSQAGHTHSVTVSCA